MGRSAAVGRGVEPKKNEGRQVGTTEREEGLSILAGDGHASTLKHCYNYFGLGFRFWLG